MPNDPTTGEAQAGEAQAGAAADDSPNDPLRQEPWREVERGLRFGNLSMMVTRAHVNQTIVDSVALAELLMEKGLFSSEEFDAARERARAQVEALPQPRTFLTDLGDKYAEGETVEIDCANRIHLCHARCCSFAFILTGQDLDEGVARWDYGNPYWIRHGADGYCVHCDPATRACGIHAQRPHVCRKFDCRQDKRIWIDFEQRIPAPFDAPPPDPAIGMARPAFARPAEPATEEATPDEPAASGDA
jgi:Fe-S-cluster containining protein